VIRKVFVIKSESKYLGPLRKKLDSFLKKKNFSLKDRSNFLLVIGEACTNSIRHAYQGKKGGQIRVALQDQRTKIVFRIRDYGQKIDLSRIKTPKLPPKKPHGLGIYLLKTMMDQLKYNTTHVRGNELILTKYKEGGAREGSYQKHCPRH